MNIAIVIVHNGTKAENEAVVTSLASQIVRTEATDTEPAFYTITGTPHTAKFLQVAPNGKTMPSNWGELPGGQIDYKSNVSATHIYNQAVAFAIDNGAKAVIYLKDPSVKLTDVSYQGENFVNNATFSAVKANIFVQHGKIDESKTLTQAFTDYKNKVDNG